MALIRSISGLRGTIGDSLTPRVIMDYCSAFAAMLPEGPVAVGRDGRPTGAWIEPLVAGTLSACGREVWLLGMVPTPTVQLTAEHGGCAGGIAITASHNPSQWNGLKFINSSGIFLDAAENEKLWSLVDDGNFAFSAECERSCIRNKDAELGRHILRITDYLAGLGGKEKISGRGLKAVVDAVNASGSLAVPLLLDELGVETVPLFCDGSGIFPHTPEPLPVNLTALAAAVREHGADIGIAVDPDADRLVLIDENGDPIGEEMTIALAIRSALSMAGPAARKHVVVNHSTSMMADDAAAMFGAEVFRSSVGEINVVKEMKKRGAVIGGEGSGGVILPECHYGRDSLAGIALVLSLLASTGKTLSAIAAEFPRYGMVKLKKEFTGSLEAILPQIEKKYAGSEIIREDGIKVITGKSWVQLRKSNTEPIVRAIAEASDEASARRMAGEILELV